MNPTGYIIQKGSKVWIKRNKKKGRQITIFSIEHLNAEDASNEIGIRLNDRCDFGEEVLETPEHILISWGAVLQITEYQKSMLIRRPIPRSGVRLDELTGGWIDVAEADSRFSDGNGQQILEGGMWNMSMWNMPPNGKLVFALI